MHKTLTATPLLLAALALSAPLAARAGEDHCRHSAPRALSLDLAGVKAVVFDIAHNDLKVTAAPGAAGDVQGKACASEADALPSLRLEQERSGDKLVVRAWREGRSSGIFLGNNYAYQTLAATLPDSMPVQLKVGSGDATVTGAPVVSADVGSGDAAIRRTRGLVAVSVGSGDIEVDDAGALKVVSIGSGDIDARRIRGAVDVGSIGSGDFDLAGAGGDVAIGSVGSGGARLRDVGGSVRVRSIGSGEVDVNDVRGDLTVESVGSGDIDHAGVAGTLHLPKRR